MIDFDDKTLDKITYDDKILIKAFGQGLKIDDAPEVMAYNLDPKILKLFKFIEPNFSSIALKLST
jgi:hypothetical protein